MQRIHDGIDNRRGGGDRPRLADALYTQRIHGARRRGFGSLEAGKISGASNEVGDQVGVLDLAVVTVDDFLQECLADALRDPTVDLAVDHHRVDPPAAIVDCHVAHDLRCPSFSIDLHNTNVGAEWIDEVRRIVKCCRLQ